MILILYGSQTGQSESIARIIEERCLHIGIHTKLFVLNDFQAKFWLDQYPLSVIVCSSTGDGDPPENASKFFRKISRETVGNLNLRDIQFALLGLGDSNYTTFQGAPRTLERHLLRLGAQKFVETGAADDQVGLELVVEPWIDSLIEALSKKFVVAVPAEVEKQLGNLSIRSSNSEDSKDTTDDRKMSDGSEERKRKRLEEDHDKEPR